MKQKGSTPAHLATTDLRALLPVVKTILMETILLRKKMNNNRKVMKIQRNKKIPRTRMITDIIIREIIARIASLNCSCRKVRMLI